jgi:hypothetical protein
MTLALYCIRQLGIPVRPRIYTGFEKPLDA